MEMFSILSSGFSIGSALCISREDTSVSVIDTALLHAEACVTFFF
jgi:hypothetical protein